MRKIFSTVMLVAAAAMTFASCQREEMNAPKETFSTTLTLNTEVDATKTYLGADNTVLWGENESVTLFVKDSNEEPATTFVNSASTSVFNGEASASFTFELTGIAESASYTIGGIYPASASQGIDNKNAAAYKVELPATQDQVDGKYDPSAFIMVLKPETVETVPSTYTASFRRAVALNKVTLTGVKENISSVEITVEPSQEGLYLAGRRYVDLTTAEFGEIYYGQTNTVTVNAPYTGSSIDVWFTSWGMDLKSGDKLTVKMTSATKTYTRTITANENGIKFVEGDLNTLKVNMASAEEVVLENLSGKYLVVGNKNDNWSLMAPTASTYIAAYATTVAATNTACAAFYEIANIESYVWTATAVDGGYTLSSYDGKYVSFPTGGTNNAVLVDSPASLSLEIDDAHKATVTDMGSGRALKYNASNPRFAFYTSGQTDIYFIPWVPDTTPRVFVSSDLEQTVGADGGEVKIEYTLKNLDGMTLTVEENSDFVSASVAAGVVTVTVDANEDTESRDATLTLKCGEAAPVSVTINQAGKQAEGATEWILTSFADLKAGDQVVIVSTKGAASFAMTNDKGTGSAPVAKSITLSGNKLSGEPEANCIWYVGVEGSNRIFYLDSANSKWLYCTSTNNGMRVGTNANKTFAWDSSNYLKHVGTTRYIGVYNSSDWRCYTTNTGNSNIVGQTTSFFVKSVASDGGSTDPTPEPEEPETPGVDVTEYTAEITLSTYGSSWSSYADRTGVVTGTDNKTYTVAASMIASVESKIQARSSKSSIIYNTQSFGNIKSIQIEDATGATFTVTVGKSSNSGCTTNTSAEGTRIFNIATDGNGFFKIVNSNTTIAKIAKIKITYTN